MARKSNVEKAAAAAAAAAVAAQTAEPEDPELPEGTRELTPGEERDLLQALRELDESGDAIAWRVNKVSGPPEERGFIEKISSAQLDLQRFRDMYGPGEYRVMGFWSDGQYVKGGHKQIRISSVAYTPKTPAVAPAQPAGSSVADLLAILKADKEQSADRMLKWATVLGPIIAPIVAQMFNRTQLSEVLTGLSKLRELQPQTEPVEAQFERLLKLKELLGDDRPQTGSTWVDVVRELAGQVKPALEGVMAARMGAAGMMRPGPMMVAPQAPIPTAALPPAAAPAGAPGVAPPAGGGVGANGNAGANVGMMQILPWLQGVLSDLVHQAKRDRDPALYAEVVLDNVPEGIDVGQLIAFVERPDWWPQLSQFASGVAPYQGWFTRFREELLELWRESRPPGAPAPPRAPDGDPPPEDFS